LQLLTRLYDTIAGEKGQGEGLGMGSNRKPIEPPKVGRIGTKRIAWINFMNNCKRYVTNKHPLNELALTNDLNADYFIQNNMII